MSKNSIEFKFKQKNRYLHSKEHVLADDLSKTMLEPKKFAVYLGVAGMYEESDLRALARSVSEKSDLDPQNRGKYFFGALRRMERKSVMKSEDKNMKRKKARKSRPA